MRKYRYRGMECKEQPLIYRSLKKYGFDAHQFNVILELKEDITQRQLDYWEQFFIDYYRDEGYQLLNIKEGGANGKHSEETKIKIGLGNQNKSVETRKKISDALKGKKKSEEHRQKMSENQKGKKPTEETRRKMSLARKGKKLSEETRQRMVDAQKKITESGLRKKPKYWLGKKRTIENRKNISLGRTGIKIKNPHHNHRKGENHGKSKLTAKQVRIIVAASKLGCMGIDLAKIFNLGSSTIYEILNGTHWSEVTGIPKRFQHKK